jgi:hypothetical protein
MEPSCACCGERFRPDRRVKTQRYCSKPECQRGRRRRWQSEKLQADREYRDNKADAQRRWAARHPGYWRRYRERHARYAERNRRLQATRNRRRCRGRETVCPGGGEVIAKMYELTHSKNVSSGVYRLVRVPPREIVKMDELTIRPAVFCSCWGGPDRDCKDRTRWR